MPKQPEADLIKWSFEQLAKGTFTIKRGRKMACLNGLQCGKSNFWRLVHNPIYCGIIYVPANRTEEKHFVRAIHEPLISENLFKQVQLIISKDCNKRMDKDALRSVFPLRGFLFCPWCGRKMTGSVSKGKWGVNYPYYHCTTDKCIGRFRVEKLNNSYAEKLKTLYLRPEVFELFTLVLKDENIFTYRREYTNERKKIENDISKQENYISKARKYLLDEKIDFDDFSKLKREHNEIMCQLDSQLKSVIQKIANCEHNNNFWPDTEFAIFRSYKDQDIKGKRDIISLFYPVSINAATGNIDFLKINEALSLVDCH